MLGTDLLVDAGTDRGRYGVLSAILMVMCLGRALDHKNVVECPKPWKFADEPTRPCTGQARIAGLAHFVRASGTGCLASVACGRDEHAAHAKNTCRLEEGHGQGALKNACSWNFF